jgi:hypothetical protein
MRLFHTTDAARAILEGGFQDGHGRYGFVGIDDLPGSGSPITRRTSTTALKGTTCSWSRYRTTWS